VELYSCGCCEGDDHCPHGYGYGIVDVDDYLDEQSTIFHRSKDESDDGSIKNMSIPVTLTKNQKKNLKRRAKRKLFHGDQGDNIVSHPAKKLQPKVIRRNVRNYEKREFEISALQGDKAKKQGCTIAHLLSNQELDNLKKKGTVVLHVTKPYYPKLKSGKIAKEIYWFMVGCVPRQVFEGPFQESVVIVTTYDQVQHDTRFCFVGSCERSNRKPETWVMLCLVVQSSTIREDQPEYNVANCKYKCKKCKNNIVSKNTGHYKS